MQLDRYEQAVRLFQEALDLPPEKRREHVQAAAGENRDLAASVQRMLDWADRDSTTDAFVPDGSPGALSTTNDLAAAAADNHTRFIGADVGPYRLKCLVGEGGFGAVYEAQQEHPVRRTVALKMLKRGMDSQQVIARFEAERQVLALMEHPGIARIIDAGQTDVALGSRPFVVMEFVAGEPITHFCDRMSLDLAARLELFSHVCHAVQHAHHKGVIHRDLKPSNILVGEVDGEPMPKVIDFGVAKAIRQPLTDAVLVTNRMELLGTPAYMSPEQVDSDERAIDTRTDVYSLGVVLYELLTGSTPLDEDTLAGAGYSGMVRAIMQQRIERPSARLMRQSESTAAGDGVPAAPTRDVRARYKRLRGELDWIALKALEIDRERRYSSAAALAEDLRRYLNREPVEAGPPGAGYRLRTFVRRHRVGVAAVAAVGLALVGGAVLATVGMLRARDSAVHARDSAAQAQQVNEFMQDVLTSVNPEFHGTDVKLTDVLRNASATVSERFAGHGDLEAQVRQTLGLIFLKINMPREATVECKKAYELTIQLYGPDDMRTLMQQMYYVRALLGEAKGPEAQTVLDDAVPRIRRVFGENTPIWHTVQEQIALAHLHSGRADEAERMLRAMRASTADDVGQVFILTNLIQVLRAKLIGDPALDRSQHQEIVSLALELEHRSELAHGLKVLTTLDARIIAAESMLALGEVVKPAQLCESALADGRGRMNDCHVLFVRARQVLAATRLLQGQPQDVGDMILKNISCQRQREGRSPALLALAIDAMPYLLRGGPLAEGEALARECADLAREYDAGRGSRRFIIDLDLARFVCLQGRLDDAQSLFDSLDARRDEAAGDDQAQARLHTYSAGCLWRRGQFDLAERRLVDAVELFGDVRRGVGKHREDEVILEFMALYMAWNKPERAAEYARLRDGADRVGTAPTSTQPAGG